MASLSSYLAPAILGLTLLAVAAAVWILPRFRVRKPELERRRRVFVDTHGRIRDAMVTGVKDDLIFYSYTVSGVEYAASQDVSTTRECVPPDPVGPASIKYAPQNPANSIVVAETWSGLRGRHPGTPPALAHKRTEGTEQAS